MQPAQKIELLTSDNNRLNGLLDQAYQHITDMDTLLISQDSMIAGLKEELAEMTDDRNEWYHHHTSQLALLEARLRAAGILDVKSFVDVTHEVRDGRNWFTLDKPAPGFHEFKAADVGCQSCKEERTSFGNRDATTCPASSAVTLGEVAQ